MVFFTYICSYCLWISLDDFLRCFCVTSSSTAGKGVRRRMWIMEKMGGQWPSLAPTNSILQQRAPPVSKPRPQTGAVMTTVSSGYLGDPKKPPFSAPRQDKATRMGIAEATPWRARLANVCRRNNIRSHQSFMNSDPPPSHSHQMSCSYWPQLQHPTLAARRGSSWCSKPR